MEITLQNFLPPAIISAATPEEAAEPRRSMATPTASNQRQPLTMEKVLARKAERERQESQPLDSFRAPFSGKLAVVRRSADGGCFYSSISFLLAEDADSDFEMCPIGSQQEKSDSLTLRVRILDWMDDNSSIISYRFASTDAFCRRIIGIAAPTTSEQIKPYSMNVVPRVSDTNWVNITNSTSCLTVV